MEKDYRCVHGSMVRSCYECKEVDYADQINWAITEKTKTRWLDYSVRRELFYELATELVLHPPRSPQHALEVCRYRAQDFLSGRRREGLTEKCVTLGRNGTSRKVKAHHVPLDANGRIEGDACNYADWSYWYGEVLSETYGPDSIGTRQIDGKTYHIFSTERAWAKGRHNDPRTFIARPQSDPQVRHEYESTTAADDGLAEVHRGDDEQSLDAASGTVAQHSESGDWRCETLEGLRPSVTEDEWSVVTAIRTGKKVSEIALARGVSEATVYRMLNEAIKKLRAASSRALKN